MEETLGTWEAKGGFGRLGGSICYRALFDEAPFWFFVLLYG